MYSTSCANRTLVVKPVTRGGRTRASAGVGRVKVNERGRQGETAQDKNPTTQCNTDMGPIFKKISEKAKEEGGAHNKPP
jgi:hypothetical protein